MTLPIYIIAGRWVIQPAHLWFLGRNFNCSGRGSRFRCELHVWDRRSDRLLFGRDFNFCGRKWCFALLPFISLFISFLHHGQFGAGFDRSLALLRRRTNHILQHTAPLICLWRATRAGSGSVCTALFQKCCRSWFFIRAFTGLERETHKQLHLTFTNIKSECAFLLLFCFYNLFRLRLVIQHGQCSGKLLILMDLLLQLRQVREKKKHKKSRGQAELLTINSASMKIFFFFFYKRDTVTFSLLLVGFLHSGFPAKINQSLRISVNHLTFMIFTTISKL